MPKHSSHSSHDVCSWNTGTYQTGFTTPPKSRNGLIAVLLVLIILLCGMVTLLGIANIRLFRALDDQTAAKEVPISLARANQEPEAQVISHDSLLQENAPMVSTPLGLEGESVPDFYQIYFSLPKGMFVQGVDPVSNSAQVGILPGDIILSINGLPITSPLELKEALVSFTPGDTVSLTVFRNSQKFQITVVVDPSR